MNRKFLWVPIIVILFFVGMNLLVNYGTNIPELAEKQKARENQPTYQERLNSMTVEDCNNVTGSSPPEVRDRCKQVWKYAPPSVSANTQEKKDKVIQKLERTYLFTNHNLDALHFNITKDMLTPEGLKICADLWEDMVQKTLRIRTGDPTTIGEAMKIQDKFQSSSCAGTQNEWKNNA